MTRYCVPLFQEPSQFISVDIDGANYGIKTRQLAGRQYISISKNSETLCSNVMLSDRRWVIYAKYKEIGGDFMPIDTQGNDNPTYDGWNDRYVLVFDTEPEYCEDYL